MSVVVIGVNHKTAPVKIREKIAFSPENLEKGLEEIGAIVKERVIVSTCNRTELYLGSSKNSISSHDISQWLARFFQIQEDSFQDFLYVHKQDAAVQHILRVVSGLDSLVLGEPQILGQVKDAHASALRAKATGPMLNKLMQYSFKVAKKVRTQTAIGANPVSVAYASVSLAKQIFAKLEEQTALLVGAGETIELVGRHLKAQHVGNIIVANRTLENAQRLADEFDGTAIRLESVAEHLPNADIVISSTAAPIPIIGKGSVERALKKRKHQPIFMVDIAIPRDIESEVGDLDDVYLYTVDDLESVIEENKKSRQDAANQAEKMVQLEVKDYMDWVRAQSQLQLICQYRTRAETHKQDVLEKALQQIQNGKSTEEALTFLAHTLTNKLSHNATVALNKAAKSGDLDTLETACKILDLTPIDNQRD
ncbi:MAG: Glutamyl-tRNA reductase (EC [uncultured Thiotrichaceae bacterium]|uniref:Glutamyl-tRNA reductase n=1 Tax=uncultured Thiotrichaceae bacterium TaxID=298394 RepID=A0A6S6T5S3_9GAMM|nr:MAG: Glutamyl-tRNA reductase (EC [uncultured Thiotrichaceae bacterium]